jgi:hypothetical protein
MLNVAPPAGVRILTAMISSEVTYSGLTRQEKRPGRVPLSNRKFPTIAQLFFDWT